MWFLSILFSLLGSSINLFFSLRYPSISITPVIALLLAHPLGRLWDEFFCDDGDSADGGKPLSECTGSGRPRFWWGRFRRWLGQGRWNRKEHACVYISSNVSFGFAFATDVSISLGHSGRKVADRKQGNCGANTLLPPESRGGVSDTPDIVYPDIGIYIRGIDEAVVGISCSYDLAQ